MFASVDNGHLWLQRSGNDWAPKRFALDDTGHAALVETLKKCITDGELDIDEGVMCSSSVDFADEHGAPEDMDVRAWLGDAIRIAAGPPPVYFKVEQLQEVVEQLQAGKVKDVIERMERNIARSMALYNGEETVE